MHHLLCRLPVSGRVEVVQTMRQHGYCLHTLLQRVAMSIDINAVSQPAHHQGVWAQPVQVGQKAPHQVGSVSRAVASSHDVYHLWLVQRGVSQVVEYDRRVATLPQS